jgi:subtilase family serine protease
VTTPISSGQQAGDTGKRAHTNVEYILLPQAVGAPGGGPPFPGLLYEDPASLACRYALTPQSSQCNPNLVFTNPSGGSKAVAIVDAYDDPNAVADLQFFNTQFGVTPGNFSVVFAPVGGDAPGSCAGPATRPPVDPTGGWEIEESLDIEYAHAMAPGATLYLVEAQSNSFGDLLCAVSVANTLAQAAGGGEVSMSWGGDEFSDETLIDSVFTAPGVVYLASAGDAPGASYPSASPNVVSVGGTSISRATNGSFQYGENVWQDGGAGPSAYEPRPSYQDSIAGTVGSQRGTPDVALDANPNTGVWVWDSFDPPIAGGGCCWYVVGGTSVASPTFAGIVNGAHHFFPSSAAELNSLYTAPKTSFTDITLGSCGVYMGYFSGAGWDFCTGLGSPRGYAQK